MKEKTILLTGASTGFGKLAAQILLQKNYKVLLGLRGGQERFEKEFSQQFSAEEMQNLFKNQRLFVWNLHMQDSTTFAPVIQYIENNHHGQLDILINNAGYGILSPVELEQEEKLRSVFETNFFGLVALTKILLPALLKAKGRILNMSSILGTVSLPFYGAYAASKHALQGYSESLAYELRPFGVQVGIIEPGGFHTSFRDNLMSQLTTVKGSRYEQFMEKFITRLNDPSLKSGDPKQVAALIVKLCEAKQVPLYSLIGKDAHMAHWGQKLVPRKLAAALTHRVFGWMFNSE